MHGLPHNFQPDYRQNFLTSLELPSIGSRTSSRNKLSSNKGKTRKKQSHLFWSTASSHFFKTDRRAKGNEKLRNANGKKEIYKKISQWYVQYKRTEIVLVQT
jgi:hypothetical protein